MGFQLFSKIVYIHIIQTLSISHQTYSPSAKSQRPVYPFWLLPHLKTYRKLWIGITITHNGPTTAHRGSRSRLSRRLTFCMAWWWYGHRTSRSVIQRQLHIRWRTLLHFVNASKMTMCKPSPICDHRSALNLSNLFRRSSDVAAAKKIDADARIVEHIYPASRRLEFVTHERAFVIYTCIKKQHPLMNFLAIHIFLYFYCIILDFSACSSIIDNAT